MASQMKCIRYQDELNPGAGAGTCFDVHAGFGKDCLKCEEVIRICRLSDKQMHCFCTNLIKYGTCPKGIKE